MDPRIFGLQRELERAREQIAYCARELWRFDRTADLSDPRTPRARSKLEADLRKAEESAAWAEIALAGTPEQLAP